MNIPKGETKESIWEHLCVVEDERNKLLEVKGNLLNSLEDCAEELRLFLELHEDDEDAPTILERAYKVITEAKQ